MVFSKLRQSAKSALLALLPVDGPVIQAALLQALTEIYRDQTHTSPMGEGLVRLITDALTDTKPDPFPDDFASPCSNCGNFKEPSLSLCPASLAATATASDSTPASKPKESSWTLVSTKPADSWTLGDHGRTLCTRECRVEKQPSLQFPVVDAKPKDVLQVQSDGELKSIEIRLDYFSPSYAMALKKYAKMQQGRRGFSAQPITSLQEVSPASSFSASCALGGAFLPEPKEDFKTCLSVVNPRNQIPVPKKRNFQWDWLSIESMRKIKELGFGSYGKVMLGMYRNQQVVVKLFRDDKNDYDMIMKEADIGALMSSMGVGPPILGLILPHPRATSNLPGVVWYNVPDTMTLGDIMWDVNYSNIKMFDLINCFTQTARLLSVMHEQGFLHNDIKPNNIIVAKNPLFHGRKSLGAAPPSGPYGGLTSANRFRVYLIDYGMATYKEGHTGNFTADTVEAKKAQAPFVAPEMFNNFASTRKSDVYSMGMLLKITAEQCYDGNFMAQTQKIYNDCCRRNPKQRIHMSQVELQLTQAEIMFMYN